MLRRKGLNNAEMNHTQVLSPKFNLSLGFLPGIVAMIAGFFIKPDIALYAGAGLGLLLCLFSHHQMLPLLLYGTTGTLLLAMWLPFFQSSDKLPLLIEGAIACPSLLLLLFGEKWANHLSHPSNERRRKFIQSIEAAIVSARILMVLVFLHLILLLAAHFFVSDIPRFHTFLFETMPLGIFITTILLNQIGLYYFNKRLRRISFVPVVNTLGHVIGKKPLLATILRSDKKAIFPVVRIAITAYNMLYLLPRPQTCFCEKRKNDLPLEGYPVYGENIEQAAKRIARELMPKISLRNLRFHFRYYYRDHTANRLVYLFSLELDNSIPPPKEGKLWTLQQIKQDLGKQYFSKFLEYEYEPLREIICTREKYKES